MTALPAVHLAATWFMVGLIWTVQVVHYPLFHAVGAARFPQYGAGHTRRIAALLVVPAAVEIVTAALLFALEPNILTCAAGALLAAIWLMTALVQGPTHGHLARGYDERTVSRLVHTNWWRTAAWTQRGALAVPLVLFN